MWHRLMMSEQFSTEWGFYFVVKWSSRFLIYLVKIKKLKQTKWSSEQLLDSQSNQQNQSTSRTSQTSRTNRTSCSAGDITVRFCWSRGKSVHRGFLPAGPHLLKVDWVHVREDQAGSGRQREDTFSTSTQLSETELKPQVWPHKEHIKQHTKVTCSNRKRPIAARLTWARETPSGRARKKKLPSVGWKRFILKAGNASRVVYALPVTSGRRQSKTVCCEDESLSQTLNTVSVLDSSGSVFLHFTTTFLGTFPGDRDPSAGLRRD